MLKDHSLPIESGDILIVDDEVANLKLLSEILAREGYHVRPANSPRLAIDSALEDPPDLILLDIRMPDMNGFEVCERLKQEERTRNIPIIFISALHDTSDKVRGFKAGGVDFISKPIQEEEVLARMRTHLKLHTMQRNLEKLVIERTAELARREAHYRALIDNSPVGVFNMTPTGLLLFANDAMARMFDFHPPEQMVVHESLGHFVDQKDFERMLDCIQQDGKVLNFQTSAVTSSGRAIHVLFSAQKVDMDIVAMVVDVTEARVAEQELEKSEELARVLLNSTTDITHLLDENGIILDLNVAMAELLGDTREKLIGTCVFDRFSPETAENRRIILRQALTEGRIIEYEDHVSTGQVFDTRVYPIETTAGEKGKIVIFAHDITAHKNAEQALKKSEVVMQQRIKQLRTILDTTPAYIFSKDIDGRFLLANKAVAEVFGVDNPDQIFGKTDFDYGATEEQVRRYNLTDRSVIASQEGLLIPEERILRKDGTLGWFQTTKVPYQHPGYDKPAVLCVAVDISDRKKVERELQRNRDFLEHLTNSIPDAIFSSKLPERTLQWAKDTYGVLGYNMEDFIGKTTEWAYPNIEEYQRFGELIENTILENKESCLAELKLLNVKGETFPAEINVTIIRKKGKPVGLIGLVRDISKRKKAERQLELVKRTIDASPDCAFWAMADGNLVYVNDASCRSLGYSRDELLQMTVFQVDPNVTKELWQETLKFLREEKVYKGESVHRRKDGSEFPVDINSIFLEFDGREYINGFVRDISERKQTDAALRRNEERLSKAQEIAHLGSWSLDLGTNQLTWSDEMYRIYGMDVGTPVSFDSSLDMVHPDDRQNREQFVIDLIDGKKVPSFSYRILRPDGSIRYIYVMAILELDDHGVPYKIEGTLQDVTDLKTIEMAYRDSEEKLRQAQSETMHLRLEMAHLNRVMTMNELAASFAHELNQPLGAIVNNANVAKTLYSRSGGGNGDFEEILTDIADDAQRAGQIIRNIRGVMKRGDVVYSSLDINQLLDEVIGIYQNTFSLNHISIVLEKDQALAPVKGDKLRLQQVLMNLIINAMDAMINSPQKNLTFRTSRSEDFIKVSISDTGPGIEQGYIDHIFEPLYTTKSEGIGIGLRLCKSIIEEHGGKIWGEHNRDSGATFSFTLKNNW
ncbi:PAS domain S-box protein [Desulfopila sp. IMCC35008]|uniref:PAS domain S-box protein n=1 Tax=Desulfopila sp. IMCC35008 TaxID=2653858 RepID=UPI0013D7D904|nr:PAS domain S-box protein [Desulfopila sp. IMCC35008]